jgi:hypothetical protein
MSTQEVLGRYQRGIHGEPSGYQGVTKRVLWGLLGGY